MRKNLHHLRQSLFGDSHTGGIHVRGKCMQSFSNCLTNGPQACPGQRYCTYGRGTAAESVYIRSQPAVHRCIDVDGACLL